MAKPRWHHMLVESQRHALKAVDEWNLSAGSYSDFITHMHRAWHYLLHAEFHRIKLTITTSILKRDATSRSMASLKLGRWKTASTRRYLKADNPVRLNVELFVKLCNKIEHRYERGLKIVTGGKAQALVITRDGDRGQVRSDL
jgi:hypothetical protein